VSSCEAVAVTGLGLWLPGVPSARAFAAGEREDPPTPPVGRGLDRMNRRRAGRLGRAVADSAAEAMEQAGADPATVPSIVGSSIGEVSTLIGLLENMWRSDEPMSPAAFTVSVHNAASGLLSISSKNAGFATSLAADEDTPGAALMEGLGLVLDRGTPVLVVCSDETSPDCLVDQTIAWDLLAAAVVLAPLETSAAPLARLRLGLGGGGTLPGAELSPLVAHNPQAGLVDLVAAVQRGASGSLVLDRGTGRGYVAHLEFPQA